MGSHAVQLLKNLRQSVATLQICGEWGSGKDEATLQMSTERVWMQGRVPQKRLTTLQAITHLFRPLALHRSLQLEHSILEGGLFMPSALVYVSGMGRRGPDTGL